MITCLRTKSQSLEIILGCFTCARCLSFEAYKIDLFVICSSDRSCEAVINHALGVHSPRKQVISCIVCRLSTTRMWNIAFPLLSVVCQLENHGVLNMCISSCAYSLKRIVWAVGGPLFQCAEFLRASIRRVTDRSGWYRNRGISLCNQSHLSFM